MKKFSYSPEVKEKFSNFKFFGLQISNVVIADKLQLVTARKKEILNEFRSKHNPDNISEDRRVKSVRELFVAMNVDPNVEPTAVENLTKLLFRGGLPSINSVVDSANLASLGCELRNSLNQLKLDILKRTPLRCLFRTA